MGLDTMFFIFWMLSFKPTFSLSSFIFIKRLLSSSSLSGETLQIAVKRREAKSKGELKSLLMKMKEESEKAGLKLSIQKTKIMASSLITSWQIDGETVETVSDFILGGLQKSLQMVTSAMKLKDAYSLEGTFWPT